MLTAEKCVTIGVRSLNDPLNLSSLRSRIHFVIILYANH